MELKPVIVALTAAGAELGRRICVALPAAQLHGYAPRVAAADQSFDDPVAHLRRLYADGRPIVGICAAGILIRALAPLVRDKSTEPAVLAMSESGQHVVPLLGGHSGHANTLALRLAEIVEGIAAVTTASDARFGLALDEPPHGYVLRNQQDHKAFVASLLAGASVRLQHDRGLESNWLSALDDLVVAQAPRHAKAGADRSAASVAVDDSTELTIVVTTRDIPGDTNTLVYHPQVLALGVGCERNADTSELQTLVATTLADAGLAVAALAGVFSVSVKSDEVAVLELAEHLQVPARFFSAARLQKERDRLVNPSEIVFREVGCHGVAEGAALAASGVDGELVVPKHKAARSTCAIARSTQLLDVELLGQGRGGLAVVGIGPGESSSRSPAAAAAISSARHIVGYSLYLELAADLLCDEHIQHRYGLGEETERVQHAIDLAAAGRRVALVCSGDAGVYAMASLACELLDGHANPQAGRIEFDVYPGISAMQAAAACVGAPLGHDFCAISLSDLLTPRAVIEHRLDAAGVGDFVIALYNPISKKRVDTFERSLEIIRSHREPSTVVVIARNLGRPTQSQRIMRLEELRPDDIDMLCVVLIGSSNTKSFEHAGQILAYTPRGYHAPASSAKLQANQQQS